MIFREVGDTADRRVAAVVAPIIAGMGGKFIGTYLAFGDYDAIAIVEMPGNVDAAVFSIAASARGAIKTVKTTPLLAIDESVEALRKAGQSGYQPPS